MGYCPECGGEFREGYEWCNLCDRVLVKELPSHFRASKTARRSRLAAPGPVLSIKESEFRARLAAWIALLSVFALSLYSLSMIIKFFIANRADFNWTVAAYALFGFFFSETQILLILAAVGVAFIDNDRRIFALKAATVFSSLLIASTVFTSVYAYYSLVTNDVSNNLVWAQSTVIHRITGQLYEVLLVLLGILVIYGSIRTLRVHKKGASSC